MSTPDRFRQQCRLLRIATLVVFCGLFLLLALGAGGLPWFPSRADGGFGVRLPLMLVRLLPGVGYLWALWAVQRALGELAAGRLFQAALVRALRQVGIGVLAGALLSVFAVTNLSRWILGGHGSVLYFDLSGIVLGVVGAALVLLARVVDSARALQAELDEIV
ncbi:DUF2975 domain-containing protein [Thermomonas haemolytica]|uniref:DUF2975 family protein n=1 Tax=Thermomonas haemolytica TaxID=141949 RepID=A0A4R3N160_9GAMM|nr:DUF2975 domain-containing protein [Thermomonas haemolytica]TCT22545.1 DUF2975 family protein [Thermomonas haemolytica]TNY29211.1 hypothetical protein BV505_05990 [Thermomonas haemolytica]